jgi:hypothetical protein
MLTYIISECIEVKINGAWYEAEILDIAGNYARVYIFATRQKLTINLAMARH